MSEGSLRLFLAVPLKQIFLQEIKDVLAKLKAKVPGVKWVEPEQVHITLHFFGDVPASDVDRISSAMQEILPQFWPVNIRLSGVGGFPDLKRPRVIWLGLEEESGGLSKLHQAVQAKVRQLGFEIEPRSFKPHATLGRVKKVPHGFSFCEEFPKIEPIVPPAEQSLDHFVLFQSKLLPQGAKYEILKTFPLTQGS